MSNRGHFYLFFVLLGALCLLFIAEIWLLIKFSIGHAHYSHIGLIPLVTGYLLFTHRRRFFTSVWFDWKLALLLVAPAVVLGAFRLLGAGQLTKNDALSISMSSLFLFGVAAFVGCFGRKSLKAAAFPVLLMLFIIPFPGPILDWTVTALQRGSAEVTAWLFQLSGVPVFRQDLYFMVPGVVIEIAKECSGIRSSMALVITGLLAAWYSLRNNRYRLLFLLVVLPFTVFKNGLRIVTLTLLFVYVDPGFLNGDLHQRGGVVFFLMALAMLMPLLWGLQKMESRRPDPPQEPHRRPAPAAVSEILASESAE